MNVRTLLFVLLPLTAFAEPTMRPCWRNVDPEARTLLAECAKSAEGWRRHADRTKLFVRGQFFYGLQQTYYIHNFYERPLMQDTSLNATNERGRMLNAESWRRTVRVGRDMRLDGFAFFPTNPGCWDLLPRSVEPGGEFPLLAEFHSGDRAKGVKHCADVADRILAAPNAFRIGGKVILTCYPTASWKDKAALDFWPELRKELESRHGPGKFALMPYMCVFDAADLDRGRMTVDILERTRGRLREILRKTDGIFYWMRESAWASPELLRRPHAEIVEPLVKGVLAEPESADKLYGVGFWQAHENVYRRFGDIMSYGVTRLVSALEEIARVQPDFAIGFEWDEQNENTHFRPTVSNGFSTQRIMRYYSDVINARPLSPYPGDEDLKDVPNLVIAYRKSVQAGEALEVQVLNVPDGTQPKGDWTVGFRWLDAKGREVRRCEPQRLASGACKTATFAVSSVDLIGEQVLYPEVTVEADGFARRTFADGFWPVNLEANRNTDCKWMRQALREIPSGVTGAIRVGAPRADGSVVVSGEIRGPKAFRTIEVLEGPDTVYLHDAAHPEGRMDDDRVKIRIGLYALPHFWEGHSATGRISVLNAPTAVLSENYPPHVRRKGNAWRINTKPKRLNFLNTHFIDMSAEEAKQASIRIDFPDCFPGLEVKIPDVLKREALSFAGPAGSQVVVTRERTQMDMPPPCNVGSADFSFVVKPRNPLSVFRLQAIDSDYRIWRGKAETIFRPTGRTKAFPVYDMLSQSARRVTVDAGRIVAPSYRFDDGHGDAYFMSGRRDLPLVAGGGVGLLTWLGCGNRKQYGNALAGGVRPLAVPDNESTRPRPFTEPDGTKSLAFDKCAFASLPLQTVPCYAGFELRIRLMPLGMEGREGLLDSGNLGFQLWLDDGVPSAFLSLGNEISRLGINETQGPTVRGPKLRKGEWNELVVRMDQREAWIEVNGVAGEKAPCCGHQPNGNAMALGTYIRGFKFFKGRISAIDVRPFLSSEPTIWMDWCHEPMDHLLRLGGRPGIYAVNERTHEWYERMHRDELVAKAEALGVNIVYTHFYKGLGLQHEHDEMERMREFVKTAHRHGIRVLGYCTIGTFFNETLADEIPDIESCAARDEDGRFLEYGGRSGQYHRWRPCPLSREYLDYYKRVIDYGAEHVGLDGFHFDNADVIRCYCDRCQKAFREYLAENVPNPRETFGLAHFRNVRMPRQGAGGDPRESHDPLVLQRDRFHKFLHARRFAEIFAHARSHGRLIIHNSGLMRRTFPAIGSYSDAAFTSDFQFAENRGYVRVEDGKAHTQILGYKFSRRFGFGLFDATWYRDGPALRFVRDADTLNRFCAQGMIYGNICGNAWLSLPDGAGDRVLMDDPGVFSIVANAHGFFRRNAALYDGTPVARTRLLFSEDSCYDGCNTEGGTIVELERAGSALDDAAVPYLIATDADIDSVGAGELLAVPGLRFTKKRQYEALRRAAGRGARILLMGEYGVFDENGVGRDPRNPIVGLQDVQGVLRSIPDDVRVKVPPGVMVETTVNAAGDFVLHLFRPGNDSTLESVAVELADPRLSDGMAATLFSLEKPCVLGSASVGAGRATLDIRGFRTMASILFGKGKERK